MEYYLVENEQKSWENGLLFWKPNSKGYTGDLRQAGLYSEKESFNTEKNSHGETVRVSKEEMEKKGVTALVVTNIGEFRK